MHAADIQDRDGGELVMATLFGLYPFLLRLYADGGYQGPLFRRAMAKIMAQVNVEIVKRSDHAKGFIVLPKRWVVTVCTMLPSWALSGRCSSSAEAAVGGRGLTAVSRDGQASQFVTGDSVIQAALRRAAGARADAHPATVLCATAGGVPGRAQALMNRPTPAGPGCCSGWWRCLRSPVSSASDRWSKSTMASNTPRSVVTASPGARPPVGARRFTPCRGDLTGTGRRCTLTRLG